MLLAGALAGLPAAAPAHEPAEPRYGGQVVVAAHLDIEIVERDGDLVLYIEDHGESVPTEGAVGRLAVGDAESGGRPVESGGVLLQPRAPNMLVAPGVALAAGRTLAVALVLQRPADVAFRLTIGPDGRTLLRPPGPALPRFR